MTRRPAALLAPFLLTAVIAACAAPPPAQAFDPTKPICTLAGLVSTLAGKVCSAARHAGTVLKAGQKLLTGHLGGALETLTGSGTARHAVAATAAAAALSVWVLGGARWLLRETAKVISSTTRPELQSTWFSATYWRMTGISALLTLPFLFAAAIQALLRSDLSLLARSALGYLPLGFLAVGIAAPVTQLLLAASDELSSLVSSASGFTTAGFTHFTGGALVVTGISASTFPLFFVGLLTVAATLTLWIELLVRAAAVYVVVLMLPLFFAALVWPARRVWATRAVELLVALIVSKFAIVAVLALGAGALGRTDLPSLTQMLAGTTLVVLAAFSPWAVLRLLPLHELASGLEGLRSGGIHSLGGVERAAEGATANPGAQPQAEEGLGPVDGGPSFAAQAAVDNLAGADSAGSPRPFSAQPGDAPKSAVASGGPTTSGGPAGAATTSAGPAGAATTPAGPPGVATTPAAPTGVSATTASAEPDGPPPRSEDMQEPLLGADSPPPTLYLGLPELDGVSPALDPTPDADGE